MLLYNELTDPQVRALAWSCFSAPLIQQLPLSNGLSAAPPPLTLTARRQTWLQALDNDPRPLRDYLQQHCRSRRLGLVFEALWHFFLDQDPDTELLAHNLPVRDGGHTLGEFDIIYHCRQRDVLCHLELAVKFYLATPTPALAGNALSQWLGPNSQDRLDLKLSRLQRRQLMLGNTDTGRQILHSIGVATVEPQLLLNGWLFQPAHGAVALPSELDDAHQQGLWVRLGDFENNIRPRCAQWYALQKPQWLNGIAGAEALNEQTWEAARRRPQMLVGVSAEQPQREALRIFLTPDDWPRLG